MLLLTCSACAIVLCQLWDMMLVCAGRLESYGEHALKAEANTCTSIRVGVQETQLGASFQPA